MTSTPVNERYAQLFEEAEATGLPFTSCASGRWIRFEGDGRAVYVVGDTWGEGCSVLLADELDDRRIQHCRRLKDAVRLAVRLVSRPKGDDLDRPIDCCAD